MTLAANPDFSAPRPPGCAVPSSLPTETGALNDLDTVRGVASHVPATSGASRGSDASYGPAAMPSDLRQFVLGVSVGDAARDLALARGTVYRLRQGYWPPDPRKIVRAWETCKARRGVVASSWFLRRVREGGTVRHAGADYTAGLLVARVGQLLAVARSADGSLIAQTLELPAQRLALTPRA